MSLSHNYDNIDNHDLSINYSNYLGNIKDNIKYKIENLDNSPESKNVYDPNLEDLKSGYYEVSVLNNDDNVILDSKCIYIPPRNNNNSYQDVQTLIVGDNLFYKDGNFIFLKNNIHYKATTDIYNLTQSKNKSIIFKFQSDEQIFVKGFNISNHSNYEFKNENYNYIKKIKFRNIAIVDKNNSEILTMSDNFIINNSDIIDFFVREYGNNYIKVKSYYVEDLKIIYNEYYEITEIEISRNYDKKDYNKITYFIRLVMKNH